MLRSVDSNSLSGRSGSANVFTVVAFVVFVFNLLLGNGYLFIPYVFYNAGIFPSCLLLLFLTFLSWLTAVWTLEIMCRAQDLEYYQIIESASSSMNPFLKERGEPAMKDEEKISLRQEPLPIYEISAERKFEIPELCEIFLGKTAKWVYTLVLCLQTFVFLWTTATIAGTTMTGIHWALNKDRNCYDETFGYTFSTQIPACRNLYRVYIAVFGVVVLPLSCLRICSQKLLQILLAISRVVVIVLIFGFYVLVDKPVASMSQVANTSKSKFSNNQSAEDSGVELFPLNITILQLIVIITCAQLIHFAIPSLVHTTRATRSIRKSFSLLYLVSWIMFTVHSLLLVTYFQDFLKPNAPHAWAYYANSSSTSTVAVAYIIQMSPVLNGMSVYPMLSVILADAFFSAFNGSDTSTIDSDGRSTVLRKVKTLAVSLSALPLVFALETPGVATIGQFVNMLSIVIVFLFPALLQFKSKAKCGKVLQVNFNPRTAVETARGRFKSMSHSGPFMKSGYHHEPIIDYSNDTPYSIPYLSSTGFSLLVLVRSVLVTISSFIVILFVSIAHCIALRVSQDTQNYPDFGRCYPPQPSASTENIHLSPNNSGYPAKAKSSNC